LGGALGGRLDGVADSMVDYVTKTYATPGSDPSAKAQIEIWVESVAR
jgi:hypothetical protein